MTTEFGFMTTKYGPLIMCGARAGLMAVVFCSLAAGAQAKTYKYKGVAYSQTVGGGCLTTSMYVTASFTVKGKLPPNGLYLSVTPLKWTMSDGLSIASNKTQPNSQVINVNTDAKSRIIAWDMSTQYVTKTSQYVLIETANEPAGNIVRDEALDGTCKTGGSEGVSYTPGTW